MYRKWSHWLFVKFPSAILTLTVISVGVASAAGIPEPKPGAENAEPADASRTVLVFGVSWQAGFCAAKPKASECQDASKADGFSLVGIWRLGKTYCDVSPEVKALDGKRDWLKLPENAMDEKVKAELADVMPGVVSGLDRHEWIKYGTCYGEASDEYYRRSLAFLSELNHSKLPALLAEHAGQILDGKDVSSAFDRIFGAGAGARVKMQCRKVDGKSVVTGLTIGLGETKGNDKALAALIGEAGETSIGCASGLVESAEGG